jgi:hypothetical protein
MQTSTDEYIVDLEDIEWRAASKLLTKKGFSEVIHIKIVGSLFLIKLMIWRGGIFS